jgi:hypothetical protein
MCGGVVVQRRERRAMADVSTIRKIRPATYLERSSALPPVLHGNKVK